ncbi:MAG: flagellar basal body protein [Proteobacteria bacterium]|nr:flagellar basal body protein [Pseudomonadota bacterium]MBU1687540.1 flagellar basal body protein [Pseudomonadota bacterium]
MISTSYSALSALRAFSKKLDVTANNTANADSDGFKKSKVTLEETVPAGVTSRVETITDPGPMVFEQTSQGEMPVEKSNVELTEELPNLLLTRRFFQANLKTIETEGEMLGSLLDIKG